MPRPGRSCPGVRRQEAATARFGEVAAEVLTETSPSAVPAVGDDADTPRPWTVVYTPGGEGGYGTGV